MRFRAGVRGFLVSVRFAAAFALLAVAAAGASADDRPARRLDFAPGTPIDHVDLGVLTDVKGRGKRFVGEGTLVLIDDATAAVSVVEVHNPKKGVSTFTLKTRKRTSPKLEMKFTTKGDPPALTKAKTVFVSSAGTKVTLKNLSQFSFAPGAPDLGLGLEAVAEDATDDVPFRLAFGNALPASVTWAQFLPPIGDQGSQGSCVGWSSGYYVKTSWEKRSDATWNATLTSRQFSPAFIYNQINGGKDQGSQPTDAMTLMVQKGAATLADMPYSVNNFTNQPSQQVLAAAANFKNTDHRFFGDTFNLSAIKQYLANTGPLVFGIKVDDAFQRGSGDYTQFVGPNLGGHAIACVGYDDARGGGSLLLANSWGATWRDQGFVWVRYTAMPNLFLGAWSMVDGPNGGGGGGGGDPLAPTGFDATDAESTGYVALRWNLLSGAASFRLERRSASGAWQTIATPKADVFHHQDFDVAPATTYTYRLAGVSASNAVGPYAETTGSTASGTPSGGTLTLTASNPASGNAFPDRIALDWNTLQGNPWYVVLRSDTEEGFRNGQYVVLDVFQGTTAYDDYVAPQSRFAYAVAAFDAATSDLVALSATAQGATSGGAGGANDIGITALDEPVFIERGFASSMDIELFNYGVASPRQVVYVGMVYYFSDGTTGLLDYADAFDGSVPIHFASHTEAPMDPFEYGVVTANPYCPLYVYPEGTADVGHWWYVEVYPANGSSQILEDADFSDNAFYGNELLFIL